MKEDKEEPNLFSKPFSKEMQVLFDRYVELYNQYDRLILSGGALYPKKSCTNLIRDMNRAIEIIKQVDPHDKLDEILLVELEERLEIMENQIELPTLRKFDYERAIRGIGITTKDIKQIEEHFRAMDFEEFSERWLTANGQSYQSKPDSTEELERVKSVYLKLLEVSFSLASIKATETYSNHEEYSKSIQFTENHEGTSYEATGRVYLNLYTPRMINIKRRYRYVPILDVFNAAQIVGEEGLLGHQGHFLITEKALIPEFLKSDFNPATMINAETLGNLGTLRLLKELNRDPSHISDINKKDFDFLRDRFELRERYSTINSFMVCYESYAYFSNNGDPHLTAEALYSIVKSPMLIAGEHIHMINAYYNSLAFWQEYNRSLRPWGYLVADMMAENISDKLNKMSDESSRNILGHLQVGHWTKKGFEKYFDYLVEKLGSK